MGVVEALVVYPAIKCEVSADADGRILVSLETNIRIRSQEDMEWYLTNVSRKTKVCDCFDVIQGVVNEVNRFHAEVYRAVILSRVDRNIVDYKTGQPLYVKDNLQIDEKERIIL